jgi:hypothetical protein
MIEVTNKVDYQTDTLINEEMVCSTESSDLYDKNFYSRN